MKNAIASENDFADVTREKLNEYLIDKVNLLNIMSHLNCDLQLL